MTEIGSVYGDALYELAKEENLTKLIGDQLAVLLNIGVWAVEQGFDEDFEFLSVSYVVTKPSNRHNQKQQRCQRHSGDGQKGLRHHRCRGRIFDHPLL